MTPMPWDWKAEKKKQTQAIAEDYRKSMAAVPEARRTQVKVTQIKEQVGRRHGVSLMTVYRALKRARRA